MQTANFIFENLNNDLKNETNEDKKMNLNFNFNDSLQNTDLQNRIKYLKMKRRIKEEHRTFSSKMSDRNSFNQ